MFWKWIAKTVTPEDEGLLQVPRHLELHAFAADAVNRTGRYVLLCLTPSEWTYTFTDEVSVYGEIPADQDEPAPAPDATHDVGRMYLERVTRSRDNGTPVVALLIDRRTHMRANLRRVERVAEGAWPAGPAKIPVQQAAWSALQARISSLRGSLHDDPGEQAWRTFITTTLALHAQAGAPGRPGVGGLAQEHVGPPQTVRDAGAGHAVPGDDPHPRRGQRVRVRVRNPLECRRHPAGAARGAAPPVR